MVGLRFVEWMLVAMVASTALLVALTLGLKALRAVKQSVREKYYWRIEPALERFLVTGEEQPELELLTPRERDRYLSALIIERMALLRGTGREYLVRLAASSGLLDRYIEDLRSRGRWRRARAAENLGYFGGERAIEPLSALLSDEDETVRAVAARALARIGTQGAATALARTLDDPSELTRLRAAENLERLGELAVKPLLGVILTLTYRGAAMAARVLGNLRARRARPALASVLLHARDEDLLAQATLALGRIGDPDDVPLILRGVKSGSWPIRAQTASALGLIGEVSAVPVLEELATDKEWWVRKNACNALSNIGPEGEKALIRLLEGDDRYARDRAAATLEEHGLTRRAAKNLAKGGKKGERARDLIRSVIRSGSTRYLRSLLEALPDDAREALAGMLEEFGEQGKAPSAEETPTREAPLEEDPADKELGSSEPATDWMRTGATDA